MVVNAGYANHASRNSGQVYNQIYFDATLT